MVAWRELAPVWVVAAFVAALMLLALVSLEAKRERELPEPPGSWWAEPGLYQHLASIDAARDDVRLVQSMHNGNRTRTYCPPISWLPDACFKDFSSRMRVGAANVTLWAHTGSHPHFGIDVGSDGNVSQPDRVQALEAWFRDLALPEEELAEAVAALRGTGDGRWKAGAGLDATRWDVGAWATARGGLGAAEMDTRCGFAFTWVYWVSEHRVSMMEGWLPRAELMTPSGRLTASPLGDAMFEPGGRSGWCEKREQAPTEARALYDSLGFRPLLG